MEHDLELFEAGDQTEVGEKGLTLSGGQKARVTLARAVYSHAEILLLDDVLAALDVHTAKWIVERCFKGDLIRGRTVILVTHNIALCSSVADYIVVMNNGRVAKQGLVDQVLREDANLRKAVQKEEEKLEKLEKAEADATDEPTDDKPTRSDGKLMVKEEIAIGSVDWKAVRLWAAALGGPWFWISWLTINSFHYVGGIAGNWWLSRWSSQFEKHPGPSQVPSIL